MLLERTEFILTHQDGVANFSLLISINVIREERNYSTHPDG
jgi:hypothetical protein